MTTRLHVIAREEDGAWGAWSPTAPDFFAAAPTAEKLRERLSSGLRFWAQETGVTGPVECMVHVEHVIADDLVVRVAQDERRENRHEVMNRVAAALTIHDQAQYIRSAPASSSGEPVIVAVTPQDTLEWIAAQMVTDDYLIAAVAVADQLFLTFYVTNANEGVTGEAEVRSTDMTVAEVMQDMKILSDQRPRTVSVQG